MDSICVIRSKEVRAAYQSFTTVCTAVGLLSLATICFLNTQATLPFELDPVSSICPLLMLSTVGWLWVFRNSGEASRRWVLLVFTEVFLVVIKVRQLYNMDQRVVYAVLASIFVLTFQVKLAYSYLASVFLAAKHIFQWILLDMYLFPEQFVSIFRFLVPMTMCAAHIISSYHYFNKMREELAASSDQVHASHGRLKTLMNALPDGILVLSETGEFLMVNRNAEALLPFNHLPLIERLKRIKYIAGRRLASKEQEPVFDDIWTCFRMNVGQTIVLGSIQCAQKYIEIQASRIEWDASPAVMVLLRDITAMIQLETNETEINCHMQMLKFVSHELTTPTVSIIGFAESLLQGPRQAMHGVEVILASAKMLLLLIGNIVDYTKLLVNDLALHKTYVRPLELIEETCALFRRQAKKKHIDYIVRIDPSIPKQIYTDSKRFAQTLSIVLSKALKFTSSGFIEVVCTLSDKKHLRIAVNDTGIGIPEERLADIKALLRNADPRKISKLGLEMANILARALGKRGLRINSSLHKGTSVQYEVKITHQHPFQSEVFSTEVLSGYSEEKDLIYIPPSSQKKEYPELLVVDDNDFNRMALAKILSTKGIQCVEARNGLEAVQVVRAWSQSNRPIKAVLMDICMPVMDGWKACKTISELCEAQEITNMPSVIGYSALSGSNDIQMCYDSGMVCYLHKPAPVEELTKTLRHFLVN